MGTVVKVDPEPVLDPAYCPDDSATPLAHTSHCKDVAIFLTPCGREKTLGALFVELQQVLNIDMATLTVQHQYHFWALEGTNRVSRHHFRQLANQASIKCIKAQSTEQPDHTCSMTPRMHVPLVGIVLSVIIYKSHLNFLALSHTITANCNNYTSILCG